ncbi:alkene reductase [Flavobacterium sp. UBA7680]|uniref:alkene reductase n=1 Tax=Flavobacterium sp. UBA7680 TaxID=1946559 RepID=UPI0025BF68C2|nr:alkene reductase [Flavobacterium sp. UBA7680]
MNTEKLFSALDFNGLKLNNRIVMAPMTRSRAINNVPNDLMALYYEQRATAGLIITEGTATSANALGYARIPGIYNQEQIEGWKKTTNAVHKKGGKIFTQLMHVGRIAHKDNLPANGIIVAPSAISAETDMWTDANGMQKTETPKELSHDEIQNLIQEFVQAAQNAIEAGFDGVEIHSANGYLLEQFLNPNSNVRTDEYGGSVENRSRFILEITKAVAASIGSAKVGIRLSPYGTFNTMPVYDEIFKTYDYLSAELNKLDIAYLHLIDYAARASEEGLNLIQKIRTNFNNALILNGGYTKERALVGLENDKADLISFGSSFISNPNLPYKLENNLELTPADPSTFYMPDEKGYTDYV